MKPSTARVISKQRFMRRKNKSEKDDATKLPPAVGDLPAELKQHSNILKHFAASEPRMATCNFIRRKKKNDNEAAINSPSALEDLPAEVKKQIAFFLSVHDLLNLDATSNCMKRDLGIFRRIGANGRSDV
ncbi:MAG: hypothetical protein SGBAC_003966 [Bacillariaceae sp.]